MDKKDIYEHLANIYLDASSKRKKKRGKHKVKNFFFINLAVISIAGVTLFISHTGKSTITTSTVSSELALVLQPDIVKINFHFDPAKKEIYAIDLNKLDLRRFKNLGFSVRKANFDDQITLKIEFNSGLKENSEFYISDIKSYKWQDYRIALSSFKNIHNWSEMSNLSFIIEESNVREKKGIVYLDNIRLLR